MSQTDQIGGRTDDLSWATRAAQREREAAQIARQVATKCFVCGRPNAGSTRPFGSSTGVRVPYCDEGVGCRDGRIYHGPQGYPHWPGEACPVCARQPADRMAGNAARRTTRTSNRSPRHR